jgi:hypothetical protein
MHYLSNGKKAAIGFVFGLVSWTIASFAWLIEPVALSLFVAFLSVIFGLAATFYMLVHLLRMAKGR